MGSLKHDSPVRSSHFNAGRTRTRPCQYCGAFFFDLERLRRHEETEGERFREEREKIVRERPGLRESAPPGREQQRVPPPPQHLHHNLNVVFYRIDRTVEEFGEDWEEDRGQIYPPFYQAFVHARRQDRAGMLKRFRNFSAHNFQNNNNNQKLNPEAALASLRPVTPRPYKEPDFQSLEENSWVTFEPGRMPRMPESRIVIQSGMEEYLSKLTEEEWVRFIKTELGLAPKAEARDVVKEDPGRMDCRHCGLIFTEVHVRKFHEESHVSEKTKASAFSSLVHRKLHETPSMMSFQPSSPMPLAQDQFAPHLSFVCPPCGRDFQHQSELLAHQNLFCKSSKTAKISSEGSRPAKYRARDSGSPARPRLADQEGWLEGDPTLPAGWKIRSRPRATQAGQLFYLFLAPDRAIFHSRRKVMEHMDKLGGYTQFDYDKVREGAKNTSRLTGNGTRKHVELVPKSEGKIKVKETPCMVQTKRQKKDIRMIPVSPEIISIDTGPKLLNTQSFTSFDEMMGISRSERVSSKRKHEADEEEESWKRLSSSNAQSVGSGFSKRLENITCRNVTDKAIHSEIEKEYFYFCLDCEAHTDNQEKCTHHQHPRIPLGIDIAGKAGFVK